MPDCSVTRNQHSLSRGDQILNITVKAAMLFVSWIMALVRFLKLFKLRRTGFSVHHKLSIRILIVLQVHRVLALPMSPESASMDIDVKSYNLNRASFMTMAAIGAIMTAVSLINIAIVIAKLCTRRRHGGNVPRHPANCEDCAATNAVLGQPVTGGAPTASSEEELSSLMSKTVGSGDDEAGSQKSPSRTPQQAAPMPLERLSQSKHNTRVEDQGV
ncbi:hypothetical protein F4678DRAFT_20692 [Xylaria arbuscula]|nr:hypothetical protein F4678DRAFT_20692 [Xylaria arbuscula]